MKPEFDSYIEGYRPNLDKALSLSGESSAYFAQYKAEKLAEWMKGKIPKKSRILDFGCGDGLMTHFVQTQFPEGEIYGVDPSAKSIEEAKKKFDSILFSVNSEENSSLCFEDFHFDLIYTAGVMHHIPFQLHSDYIGELARILKPGGFLVVFELNPLNPLTVLTFKRNPIDRNASLMAPWYTKKLIRGYGRVQIKFYCFFPKVFRALRISEPYLTKVPLGALYAAILEKKENEDGNDDLAPFGARKDLIGAE